MIIQCDKCRTRFRVDDSKIPDKGAKIKCKKCQHLFEIRKEPKVDVVKAKPEEGVDPVTSTADKEDSAPSTGFEHGGFWGADPSAIGEEKKDIPEEKSKEDVPGTKEENFFLPEFKKDFDTSREVEENGVEEESVQDDFIAGEEDTAVIGDDETKSSSLKKIVILVLLILIVTGVGVYFILGPGSGLVSNIISGKTGKVNREEGTLGIAGLKGYYHDNKQVGRLFVIEGRLVNPWNFPITSDKVKGAIFDNDGKKVQEEIVAPGSILNKSQLTAFSIQNIEDAFRARLGRTSIEAGKSLPFMIVFFNVPEGLSEFLVEVSEWN